jgi:hypothetical protein
MKKLAMVGMMSAVSMSVMGLSGLANAQSPTAGLGDITVQQNGQTSVYLEYGGQLHWIPSSTLFQALGLQWSAVQHVSALPESVGQPVNLIRQEGHAPVYLIQNGQLHWIPSWAVFQAGGYHWQDVETVNFLPLPVGSNATNSVQYELGTWNVPGSALTFFMEIPSAYQWTQAVSPYRPLGEVFNADGGRAQVALSLNPAALSQYGTPTGETILQAGGDSGARVSLWTGTGGRIHGTEIVSMGTTQYGWQNPLGHPGNDQTFLLNVTLPNTPQNVVWAEDVLAMWRLSDNNTGASYGGQQPAGHQWLPGWPANPLNNSNAGSMPGWLQNVSW